MYTKFVKYILPSKIINENATTIIKFVKRSFLTMAQECPQLQQLIIKAEPQTQIRAGEEVSIPLPWGHIAGKEWGSPGGQPILAYHGMQDNCCSFDLLAPLLPSKYHLVSVDLPGYGQSSPYPLNTYATFIGHVVDFKRTLLHFGWEKVTILGHSYGGAIATYIAALCPDLVSQVIAIETAKPLTGSSAQVAKSKRARADAMLALSDKAMTKNGSKQKLYTIDEAVQVVLERLKHSMTEKSARLMIQRNVTVVDPEKDLVTFNYDVKNLLVLQIEYDQEETEVFAKSLGANCDNLFIFADAGGIPEWAVHADQFPVSKFLNLVSEGGRTTQVLVEGTHHVHLNHPERVASLITEFLETSRINPKTKHEHYYKILCEPETHPIEESLH